MKHTIYILFAVCLFAGCSATQQISDRAQSIQTNATEARQNLADALATGEVGPAATPFRRAGGRQSYRHRGRGGRSHNAAPQGRGQDPVVGEPVGADRTGGGAVGDNPYTLENWLVQRNPGRNGVDRGHDADTGSEGSEVRRQAVRAGSDASGQDRSEAGKERGLQPSVATVALQGESNMIDGINTLIVLAIGGVWTAAWFIAGMIYRGNVGTAIEQEITEKLEGDE